MAENPPIIVLQLQRDHFRRILKSCKRALQSPKVSEKEARRLEFERDELSKTIANIDRQIIQKQSIAA